MTTSSLVACNANPKGTGLYSCGGKVGLHLRIQQTVLNYLHFGEIRAYSVQPTPTSDFSVSHSTYSTCSVGSQNLWLWPVDASLKAVTMITGYSTCRQSLAGGNPAYYQVDFNGSRFVHAVTILGAETSSYIYSQNWKLYVLTNQAYQQYGQWGSVNDSYGKEVTIGSSTTSIRIQRIDGLELRLFWVGIFSTLTDCTGTYDWSESWQTSTVTLKVPSATTTYIVRAKLGDCPIAHFLDLSATYPSYVAFDSASQTLSLTPPAGINTQLTISVKANSNYGPSYKQEQRDFTFNICTQTMTASPASLTLSLEIAGQALTTALPTVTPSISPTITYGLDSNAPSFFHVSGSDLVIDSIATAGTFSFRITATDSTCSDTITIAATITLYHCQPIGFTLSATSVEIELLSPSQTFTWSQNTLNSLCGVYSVTSNLTSTVQVNGQSITILTSTAVNQTVLLTLTRQSNTSMTATASLAVKVYDCTIIGFALSVSSISLELKSTPGSLSWSMTAVDTLCGTYSVTSDQPLKVYAAPLKALVVETQTAEIYLTIITLTRNNNTNMTTTASLQVKIYDCQPTGFVLSATSTSLQLNSATQTLTWTSDNKDALCGTYSVNSDSTLVQVNGSNLTVQTNVTTQQTVTLTLQRDAKVAMKTTSTLFVNIYDCTPTGFALSTSSVAIELNNAAPTLTWTMNLKDNLCGSYTITSDAPSLVQVSGTNITVLSLTAVTQTVQFTLTRDSNTSVTATASLAVKVYDCRPTGFTLSVSSISLELQSTPGSLTWSMNALDPLCGAFSVTSDCSSKVQVTPLQTLDIQTSTAESYLATLTITRDAYQTMKATTSLQVTIYDCQPTSFVLSLTSISIELNSTVQTLTWTSDAKNQLCGTYSVISASTLVLASGTTLSVQTNVTAHQTVTITLQRDAIVAMKTTSDLFVNIYDCTPTGFSLSTSSVAIELNAAAQTLTWIMDLKDNLCGSYSVTTDILTLIQVSGQTIRVLSSLAGLYTSTLTLSRDANPNMKTTKTLQVNVYDCAITGFTLTPSTVSVEFLGPSQTIVWSNDPKDPLCGSYDIESNPTLQPKITTGSNFLAVQSTASPQLPTQTFTITLQRLQNSAQTATASLQVGVYCVKQNIVFTKLESIVEVKVGIDLQPIRIPFKVDPPCYQPAQLTFQDNPSFLQVESLTDSSGNIKIENATGAMHGLYQLNLIATTVAATTLKASKDFSIFINGCSTSTFVHQAIPNTEVFIQSGLMTGEIRFNEFQHTFGMLGRDCGKTVYRLSLSSREPTPSWVQVDSDNKMIKYDVSSVGKSSQFAFELHANLELYPLAAISEPFNITVASSEIKCNQLPPAIYYIGEHPATFSVSYSNQTYATQTRLTKEVRPVFKRQGSEVPQPKFLKYSESIFTVSSMKFEDVDNYQLGLRIGYLEFPAFQVTCELSLSVNYRPKFYGDLVEDRSVSCEKPMNFTLPEYTDFENQPAQLSVDFGAGDQLFIFDQASRRIFSKPAQFSGITQTFPVEIALTDSHGYSSTFTFNLQVSCRVFGEVTVAPKPYKKPSLDPPKPFITSINSSGLLRVQFTRKIVIPTYDIYPELKPPADCEDKCDRMLNATSDEEQAIQIMNTAQVTRNETTMPIIDAEIIPGMYSNITNLNFSWKCVKFDSDRMDIKLNFTQADVVSIFSERDSIILHYNGYSYFKSDDGQTFPADLIVQRTLAPQMDSQLAATLNFVADTVASTSKTIIVMQFILKLIISQSLQQMFASINKLQILTHLPLVDIAVAANAWSFCASFVSLVNFELYDLGPIASRVLALKNDHAYSDSFADYGYGSRFFVINLSNLYDVFLVFIAGLLLVVCLDKASNLRLLRLRYMLRRSLIWGAFVDYFNEACLPIALSCLISYKLWSFKSFGEAFDQLSSSSAMIAVFIAVPLFKLLYLQHKRNDLRRPQMKQEFQALYQRLRFNRTRWALVEPFISDLRRLILAVTIIGLQRYPTFQLMSLYFQIVAVTIFNGEVEPFADPTNQRLEQFNELTISGVFYHFLCFADLVKDPATRMKIGWSMIGTTLFCLTVNFGTVLFDAIRNSIKKAKLYRLRKKLAKRLKSRQRIDEERQKQLFRYQEDLRNEELAIKNDENLLASVSSLEDAQQCKSNRRMVVDAKFKNSMIEEEEPMPKDISGFKFKSALEEIPDISQQQSPPVLIPLAQKLTRSELAKRYETTMRNYQVDLLVNPSVRDKEWKLDEADFAAYEKFLGRKIE